MNSRLLWCLGALAGLVVGVVVGPLAAPVRAQIAMVASPSGPVPAGPYLVIDAASGETLLERNAGAFWYPASLAKLMTIYIVFEELKSGRLSPSTPVPFSDYARSMPPSKLGLAAGQTITVEQALQALVARSANDVATALGELVAGSTPAFARRMTETAARLGMTGSQFRNANGLPDASQMTTARDMAILAMALVKDFPQYYGFFHTQEFMLGKMRVGPGIKFLELYAPYADGMKTGFICASGFNIVGSAVRDGRRLIAVAFGFRRADLRDEFIVRLLDEAFSLKTGGNRPKVWQVRNGEGGPGTIFPLAECGGIHYDMPGDAAWLGTFPDWKSARHAYDNGQAELVKLGVTRLGKEWILPVTANKLTHQAAIIADLEPDAAQKLCGDYLQRKLFCQVRKPTDFVPPFGAFWR
jgi:D-alanyl-D-alanine carboxypeptidase